MNSQPLINILTRTSGRPNYFERCFNSVENQTYKNINHIISVDDDNTEKYVKKHTDNYIRVNKYDKDIPRIDPITRIRRAAPYNLYLNELRNEVKDGWILYLDDDDVLMNNNVIEELVSYITTDDQLFLWRVQFPDKVIPESYFFNKNVIAINHFSMIGFMYHKKYDSYANFDYFSGGDFHFISQLAPKIPSSMWINKIYTGLQRNNSMGGFGKKDDLVL